MAGETSAVASSALEVAGDATGIPGLGQVGALIGSLIGPKPHYTAGGVELKTANADLYDQEGEVNALYQQLYGKPLDTNIPPNTGTNANRAYLSGLVARYLNDPSLSIPSGAVAPWRKIQEGGDLDQATAIQSGYLQQLQDELNAKAVEAAITPAPVAAAASSAVSAAATAAASPLFKYALIALALFAAWKLLRVV